MPPARRARAGMPIATSFEPATSLCRVSAPMVSVPPSSLIPPNSSSPPRSTSAPALARRSLSAATRDWPPASGLALSTLRSSDSASFIDLGRWYSKACMSAPVVGTAAQAHVRLGRLALASCGLHRAPDPLGRCRHLDVTHAERPQRIGDRVHHRGRRADGARFAATLHTQRVVRAGRLLGADLE